MVDRPETATSADTLPVSPSLPKDPFADPYLTAKGERRAWVAPGALTTLWFNTGTLCNLACAGCYIDSSPTNDALVYLSRAEVCAYLDEIDDLALGTEEVGLTGGEPFMNPDIDGILEDILARGHRLLVLSNAMKPMTHHREALLRLKERHGDRLSVRVSLDHYTEEGHARIRGARAWAPALEGIEWLAANGFALAIACRHPKDETDAQMRRGFADLLEVCGIALNTDDPAKLVLFPEMDEERSVPEITESCWGILDKAPESVMCASSRMVVKHKGARRPSVIACTLLPYDARFDLGSTLEEALRPVSLNHRFCAQFCVLGDASCS